MSHVSTYKIRMKDLDVLKTVLEEKGIEFQENCTVNLYGSQKEDAALSFKLPGWRFAVVVKENGEIKYDHFGSQSNTMSALGETVQAYNKEVITNKAWGFANNIWEEKVSAGIKLTIEY